MPGMSPNSVWVIIINEENHITTNYTQALCEMSKPIVPIEQDFNSIKDKIVCSNCLSIARRASKCDGR